MPAANGPVPQTPSGPRPASSPRVVLHAVDRVTGGVPVAVRGYIANTPPGIAHVVAAPFASGAPAPVWNEGRVPEHVRHLEWDTANPVRAVTSLRRLLADLRPDVVHAHSSFPGVYARVAGSGPARMVYTPHCFAHERRDIGWSARTLYRGIERALRGRVDLLAAGGPGEALAAAALGYGSDRVRVIPNVPSIRRPSARRSEPVSAPSTLRVGMLGRWAPQKDPNAFAEAVESLRHQLPGVKVRAKWIGGAEGAVSAPPGIDVTGWQSPEGVAAELEDLDVYLHTAAWEAAVAIAVLDAFECDLPILARPIPAMPGLPGMLRLDSGMRPLVDAVRAGRFASWAAANRSGWERYLNDGFTLDAQRAALQNVWG